MANNTLTAYLQEKHARQQMSKQANSVAVLEKIAHEVDERSLGLQAEAAYEGIKEASQYVVPESTWDQNYSELAVDPQESRQHRLNNLLRRY